MPASASADADLLRLLRHAAAFDRMAAIQLRRIALMEPHLAERLRHIANQLEADAAEMEKRISYPTHLLRTQDMAQTMRGMTDAERFAHYGELATQFREWAKTETNEEARAGLLDMARQYERLAAEIKSKM